MSGGPVPVFILSLPRSGSTLVQRVLAAHAGVATASEPWLLLPWLSPLQDRMPQATAWHHDVHDALVDFSDQLPGGRDDYRRTVHDAALELYAAAAGPDARFFVDKTPPYSMIIDEVARTFPQGRLVFLWRNPLSVVSSVVETFAGGRWKPADYPVSLFWGTTELVAGFQRWRERAHGVRYEDLLTGDHDTWRALCDYIGLPFEPEALERFAGVELAGRMGDPTGVRSYDALSTQTLEKWKTTVSTPVRQAWCRRYLRWLGAERLTTMGYDLDALLSDLDELRPEGGNVAADVLDTAGSLLRAAVRTRVSGNGGASAPWRSLLGAR